jgi:uncharacterized repeat protein (TIGR03806 family)
VKTTIWIPVVVGVSLLVFSHFSCKDRKEQFGTVPKMQWDASDGDILPDIPARLSGYGAFEEPLSKMIPGKNTYLYDVNAPLFSDYADKNRFIYLPDGAKMTYSDTEVFDFPDGAIIFKFFSYKTRDADANQPEDIVETRVLIKRNGKWEAYPYVWDMDQKDAYLHIAGFERTVTIEHLNDKPELLSYSIPDKNQCKSCHELNKILVPIGVTARQLNRKNSMHGENQLNWWINHGLLTGTVSKANWPQLSNWEDHTNTLELRARAYLESNCAHCHRPQGPARNSALNLLASETNPAAFGIGKTPVAAGKGSGGLKYDIVPGAPNESILLYRMKSTEPGIMMPELGRKIAHQEGVELISEWIKSLN